MSFIFYKDYAVEMGVVAGFIILAAITKSAQIPFSA
jgi:NADH:ubiquinone oxidoreductase subunit 5 (subunit L)/multisubunit Na+/H+ antiporter MnhA subunit